MKIEHFGVEIWMNEWETKCELNLAETCVESLTVEQLLDLCGTNSADLSVLLGMKLTYGAIEGSDRLRTVIASLYEKMAVKNVLVTHGTIGANMLVHRTLVEQGDRVIAIVPTYQQHYSIPESMGADIQLLQLQESQRWLPDLDRLRELASGGAKLIALTNPNNPTGALIPRNMLEDIASIAREAGAWVLCDEVYRGIDQVGDGTTASMADLYERGISTASMSKAYSLAGLRLGWIAGPEEIVQSAMIHRDYDTISVGMIDDHFAAMALENRDRVLDRSRDITRNNLQILSDWLDTQPHLSWIRPQAGTTALVKFDLPMSSQELCVALVKETGVMFTPGSAMGMEGYIRIGYANSAAVLKQGLERVGQWLSRF